MKFNVPSKSLYSFVSAVNKVINSKNAMTILNNFLFYLNGDKLQLWHVTWRTPSWPV